MTLYSIEPRGSFGGIFPVRPPVRSFGLVGDEAIGLKSTGTEFTYESLR